MSDIQAALGVDIVTLVICVFALLRYGRISAMHPATTYLFFHLWVVTKRLVELNLGAPLFSAFPHQPISREEITRAVLMFDLTLFMMTSAWLLIGAIDFKSRGPLPAPGMEKPPNLSKSYVVGFAVLMIPFAFYGFTRGHSGATEGVDGAVSTVSGMFNSWLPLCLMPLLFWYGPKKWLLVAILFAMTVCELYMGQARWLLLLPTIFFCFAYLSRAGLKWPPRKVVLILIAASILWLPGKQISNVIIAGGGIGDVAQAVSSTWISSATQANHPDTDFLDMAAMTVSLVDEKKQFYYGNTMFPALYNFVPRALWPDKPLASQWEVDISTKDRPMHTYGMTASMMGAAYVDFGYFGVVLIPFLFALFLGWAYFQAFRSNHYSVARFSYLVMACILLQPYRDGVYTFFIFNYVCMLPMYLIVLLHLLLPTRPARRSKYPAPLRLTPAQPDSQTRSV